MLGQGPSGETETTRFRRGGYAARDIAEGEVITSDDIASLRPANLFPPHLYEGMLATKDLKQGDSLDG
jgi:sialic acid synthase SpsE